MAFNTDFIAAKKILPLQRVRIATANVNRDGTGTIADLMSAVAPTEGARIEGIRVVAEGTTTAGVIRLFTHDGTNWRLFDEILVTAVTPSTTVKVWEPINGYTIPLPGGFLNLPSGYKLGASTHNAEAFIIHVAGGSYDA